MTIDIRANVYCSLGPVISGNFADEAVQGSGLVKTRGQVELAGVFRPDVGQVVEFAWTRGTIGARLPRKLRVLSSFADPFRAITTVQIGCKLTQFEDVTPNIKIRNQASDVLGIKGGTVGGNGENDDPASSGGIPVDVAADEYLTVRIAARRAATGGSFVASALIPTEAAEREAILKEYTHLNRYVTFPLSAARIVEYLCSYMKITLAAAVPLVNQYVAVKEFDLRNGILPLLSDLLISENYFGYLNERERLVIRSLEGDAGVGPVFDSSNIIDLRAIGVGNRPGETVIVNYTTARRLKPEVEVEAEYEPDGAGNEQLPPPLPLDPPPPPPPPEPPEPDKPLEESFSWTQTVSTGFPVSVPINYTTLAGDPKDEIWSYTPVSKSYTEMFGGRVLRSFSDSYKPFWAVNTAYTAQVLTYGLAPSSERCVNGSETTYTYDELGRQASVIVNEYATVAEIAGGMSLQYVFESAEGGTDAGEGVTPTVVGIPQGVPSVSKTVTKKEYRGNFERTITDLYQHWSKSQAAQQGSTEGRLSFESASRTADYIKAIANSGLDYIGTSDEITITSPENQTPPPEEEVQEPGQNAPPPIVIERDLYGKPPQQKKQVTRNKFNTEVVQESATLIYSYGAVDAERIVSLTIPYTGDDVFDYSDDAGLALGYQPTTFKVQPSQARQKAMAFGRCQNRLLLGNRQGVSIQVAAELMPREPFAPLYINADGLTGQYRCNAASWTFSAEGIVASVDALFWGGIGS